ncbi:MAG: DUF4870 domain-containing protein [Ignavibacteria bacterium]|nr:DUF4870 domain-containing protein [Ignavibacteria bacterium]
MNFNNTNELTNDERLFALLSHLSVVLGGILMPIIIWAVQKDKSKFIRFHSLQAIFYNISIGVIIALIVIILAVLIALGAGFGALASGKGDPGAMPLLVMILLFLFYGLIFIMIFAYIGYGIYLAVKSYGGALIKIPVIGNIIYRKVYGNN